MTSRAGYDIAMPYFLREVDFTEWRSNWTVTRIRAFCKFMLADPERCIPHLRVLRLHGFVLTELGEEEPACQNATRWFSCPCQVSRVLKLATGLRELQFMQAEQILGASKCFFDALVALPALDVVCLDGGPQAFMLLSNMTSRSRIVDLQRVSTAIHLPESLSECLEDLRLSGGADFAVLLHHHGVVFPRLRVLTMTYGVCGSLTNVASALPNLRTLKSTFVRFPDQPAAGWSSGLDCVQFMGGPGLGRWAIPLACRVRRLKLLTRPDALAADHALLAEVLSKALPTVLFYPNIHEPLVTDLARPAPGLKYLHIVLPSLDEDLVTKCATALRGVALEGISLGYARLITASPYDDWEARLARKVGECVPSLAYVGLHSQKVASRLDYSDLDALTWYRIERDQRIQKVEQLSWWEAEQTLAELTSLE
ncbi:hypothetical protein C8Q72DRAFT_845409 [Fomitopsis betulina]|nr:hypothetical protein C8Q72DRAFT_845409 [Fomitopsis betulina]